MAENFYQILIMYDGCGPGQIPEERFGDQEQRKRYRSRSVVLVPAPPQLRVIESIRVVVETMTVAQRIRRVAGNHAIVWKRKLLRFKPCSGSAMRREDHLDPENRREPAARWTSPIPALLGHVGHDISHHQTRGKTVRAAKARYRGQRMFKIRFTADRAVDERKKAVLQRRGSSGASPNQRRVGVHVKTVHGGDYTRWPRGDGMHSSVLPDERPGRGRGVGGA